MSKHLFGAETPRTEVFEGRYAAAVALNLTDDNPAAREAFRKMIRRERAEAKVEALREAAEELDLILLGIGSADELDDMHAIATAAAQGWLAGRANRIEKETT